MRSAWKRSERSSSNHFLFAFDDDETRGLRESGSGSSFGAGYSYSTA